MDSSKTKITTGEEFIATFGAWEDYQIEGKYIALTDFIVEDEYDVWKSSFTSLDDFDNMDIIDYIEHLKNSGKIEKVPVKEIFFGGYNFKCRMNVFGGR